MNRSDKQVEAHLEALRKDTALVRQTKKQLKAFLSAVLLLVGVIAVLNTLYPS